MTQRRTIIRLALATTGLGALLSATGALAHHSFAMFDMTKKQSISGTVRTLEWTNPHVWLWVDVSDGKGGTVTYGFEGAAPGEMTRNNGWNKRIVAAGDRVSVEFSPLKDGRPGGTLGKVTTADGKLVGTTRTGGGPGGPGAPGGPAGEGGPPPP